MREGASRPGRSAKLYDTLLPLKAQDAAAVVTLAGHGHSVHRTLRLILMERHVDRAGRHQAASEARVEQFAGGPWSQTEDDPARRTAEYDVAVRDGIPDCGRLIWTHADIAGAHEAPGAFL